MTKRLDVEKLLQTASAASASSDDPGLEKVQALHKSVQEVRGRFS